MNNIDDYRGRLLARAFHDELEKLSTAVQAPAQAPGTAQVTSSGTAATTAKPLAPPPKTRVPLAGLDPKTAKPLPVKVSG
jgi:hypothetical protein